MKITDRRTAKVWFVNSSSESVTFLIIPLEALVYLNGIQVLMSDRTEKIVLRALSDTALDIPAGYRIGVDQSRQFSCRKIGATGDMNLTSIGDEADPGDIIYNMTADCARQGDVIDAIIFDPE